MTERSPSMECALSLLPLVLEGGNSDTLYSRSDFVHVVHG